MTTLHSAGGPSEVITARRTESLDAPSILKLVQPVTESLFGRVNVVNLIERASLAVTLSNESEEVLGHAAFLDYPNLSGVDSAEWQKWFSSYYESSKCNPLNTLFLHYFVAKSEYSHGCCREIIRTMFNAVPDLHYCYLLVPKGVFPDSALAELFQQLQPLEGSKDPDNCVVFGCYRHAHVPVLHVREAKVEDHDDLVPIFNRQSDTLSSTYGDYFLAELIEAQDDSMKCLVAEVDGTAVGFMSLSSELDTDLLNDCFELGPFHGLRKPHPDDETIPPKTPTPTPQPEATERPVSAQSDKSMRSTSSKSSTGSKGSASSKERKLRSSRDSLPKEKSKSSMKTKSTGGDKHSQSQLGSSAQSVFGSEAELKIEGKLTDSAVMAGGSGSLLSDHSDVESIQSAASDRSLSKGNANMRSSHLYSTSSKPPSPQFHAPTRFLPSYKGDVNAFSIQLFCVDERYEMRSSDFLARAFELLPQRDFCVITVPHLVPEFPLLQRFVRVTPRVPSTLSEELYVFGKAGLSSNFSVRPAVKADTPSVEKLIDTLDLHENLLSDLTQYHKAKRDDDGTELQSFVAVCEGQVVGVALLRREECRERLSTSESDVPAIKMIPALKGSRRMAYLRQILMYKDGPHTEREIEYVRSHYNIEDFIYYNHHRRDEHGRLHHYALNPIFRHLAKYFMKEILRQGHKTCLYYPLFPNYVDKEIVEKQSLICALQDMVPVRGRRQIIYPLDALKDNAPSDRVLKEQEPYALVHLNRKLTLEPRLTINARIVVVGASDVSLGFLETFAFCPHLRFNNLTLISPHGLPGELPPDILRDHTSASSHCYSQEEYAQLALRAWVNVVFGKMTAIDRKKKHVVVNGRNIVPYDHLVLSTGLQYQPPSPTEADVNSGATNHDSKYSPTRILNSAPPKNLFTINDSYDAAVALYWMENSIIGKEGNTIIYGDNLDAYCCIQSLLTLGVPGSTIHLVLPPKTTAASAFLHLNIEQAVTHALADSGVTIHNNCYLAQWEAGPDGTQLTQVSFTTETKPVILDCRVMFSYFHKQVDWHAFRAINDSCLVFDGKLVIDASFHTNDVAIRGAGPVSKFQRCYHAEQWTHANFNSKEVGIQLASSMLGLFDPTMEPDVEPPSDLLKLIPMYRSPKVQAGILPGGYQYLHVAKPGLHISLDVLKTQSDYGRDFTTGSPGGEQDYFCLHVNQNNTVQTVICLARQPFASRNLTCLYGLHERYLNNLVSRYDEGLIDDLYSYFQETWSLAIFHDRFADFRDEVRELLVTRPNADAEALEEQVRHMIDEDSQLNKEQRSQLNLEYKNSGAKRAVETRLLSFLSYNRYHMPMYAKPGMV